MPLIHKTNKTSRPVKKGRKYKEITAQQYMFSCDPFSCVTVSSIKIIQNPNASVAHQFDILSYQVLSPLPTVAAPSLENLSEDFLRAQIRGTWGRWGDKGGKSRSGGGGWVWCKPASNNDFLTLLAACWTAAFKHKSRQRLISGEFHSRVFKTKDTHTNSRESSFNHAVRRTGTR